MGENIFYKLCIFKSIDKSCYKKEDIYKDSIHILLKEIIMMCTQVN